MSYIKYSSFLKIVQLGSLTKAGEELGYSQSGISHMLNALEQECGVQLLYRDRSGIQLTSNGKTLLPYFISVCSSQYELDLAINEIIEGISGLIRIAASTSIAGQWLPYIFHEFRQIYPNVKFELHEVFTSYEVNELIKKKKVDCGFIVSSSLPTSQPLLYVGQLVAVLSPEHELAKAKLFPMDALDAYPYIVIDEPVEDIDTYTASVAQVFASQNKMPQVNLHVMSEYTALSMIATNQGYCILPETSIDRTKHKLVYLPLEKPFPRYIFLVWAENLHKAKLHQHFIQYTQSWIKHKYADSDHSADLFKG